MTDPAGTGGGLFDSLRRLAHTALGIAEVRLELLGTELEQEKLRVAGALLLGAIAFMLLTVALLLLTGFVVLLFWDGYRLPAIAVLALLFGLAGLWALSRSRARLRASQGGPFALSLGELRRDRNGLAPPGE
ncbi:MAG: phage holin family protein [Aquincola sp.]|nr:phage holin family protein [Aquincola sp.]MDH5329770.1 phage holin family protein [Aquincola sp.]